MHKQFQYRLYPKAPQVAKMQAMLEECRWLYNHFLEQRKLAWEERGEKLSLYDQLNTLPSLKRERPSLASVHSQVLQNVGIRLDLAFQAFFRRVKAGETPGYPRFRSAARYDSFCYPQAPSGCRLKGDRLTLSGVGSLKVVLHRPLEGKTKTCCVRRSATGKWYVTFSCECEPTPLGESPEHVGIDVGLTHFATLSTGETIENPRFFRQEEAALGIAQRNYEKELAGTARRRKRRKIVARVHERTRWRRQDFAHQQSRRIVNRFQVIAVEDLTVNQMIRNYRLAKSISDAAWAAFTRMISCKAACAGRTFIAVNPAYTSQTCSACGQRQKMPLVTRVYHCPSCSLELDRDHNAALNILAVGLHGAGLARKSPPL